MFRKCHKNTKEKHRLLIWGLEEVFIDVTLEERSSTGKIIEKRAFQVDQTPWINKPVSSWECSVCRREVGSKSRKVGKREIMKVLVLYL